MKQLLKKMASKFNVHESKMGILKRTIEIQDREYDLVRVELSKKNHEVLTLEAQIEDLKKENSILLERKNKYLSQVKKMRLELKKVANEE